MNTPQSRSPLTGIAPILGIVLLLLTSLLLMSDATEGSARFGQLYSVLLVINVVGLVLLAGLIGWNVAQLATQVRHKRPGAQLTLRMVALFTLLAVTPVLVVYYFSLQFLNRGIDSWFDVRVDRALEDSLDLSRAALDVRMRELRKETVGVALDIGSLGDDKLPLALEEGRTRSGAFELTLTNADGQILAFSNVDPSAVVPVRPSEDVMMQLRQGGEYIGLDSIGSEGSEMLFVRVALNVSSPASPTRPRVLQALFPMSERVSALADSVQSAYGKYSELAYLRTPLKRSFTLTLSLVLLLSLFTAVWAAFFSARRVVSPLSDLAQGTRAVAAGEYGTQLPAGGSDEVGFLVHSFNDMTRRLTEARDATRASQQQVEDQRAYLEAVLGRLSTGVLTLDDDLRVHTANEAAAEILGVDLNAERSLTIGEWVQRHPHLEPVGDALERHLSAPAAFDWREELLLFGEGGSRILMLSGTRLQRPEAEQDTPEQGDTPGSNVVVFDDITALIQAQRNAAWSEVARRLAHEIKNPLTPIQLSAERLRHKYLGAMDSVDDSALDRLTRTIVSQVEAMKGMVNAFSEYARMPAMRVNQVDLNALVLDVVELYQYERLGADGDAARARGQSSDGTSHDPDKRHDERHDKRDDKRDGELQDKRRGKAREEDSDKDSDSDSDSESVRGGANDQVVENPVDRSGGRCSGQESGQESDQSSGQESEGDRRRRSEESRIVSTRLDPALPLVEADADRLRQVLHNLIKNAMEAVKDTRRVHARGSTGKYEANEPLVSVQTRRAKRAKSAADAVEMVVSDRGPGFAGDVVERVFEPYVTTKVKGSGLGLAIVHKIVEEHGGRVWAENPPEGGARVVVRLQLSVDRADRRRHARARGFSGDDAPDGGGDSVERSAAATAGGRAARERA